MSDTDIFYRALLVCALILSCGIASLGYDRRHSWPYAWNGRAVFPVIVGLSLAAVCAGTLIAWQVR